MPIQFHCNKCQGWIEVDDEYAGSKAICPFCQAINNVPGEARKGPVARPAGGEEHRPAGKGAEPSSAEEGPHAYGPEGTGPYTDVPTESTRPGAPEVPISKPLSEHERERLRHERAERDLGRFDASRAGLPPPPPRSQRLTRLGAFGLVGAILSIVLMIVPATIGIRYLPKDTLDQFSRMQELPPDQRQEFMQEATTQFAQVLEDRPWIGAAVMFGMLLWVVSLAANVTVAFSAGFHRRGHAWAGLAVNAILLFLCLCSGIMQRVAGV